MVCSGRETTVRFRNPANTATQFAWRDHQDNVVDNSYFVFHFTDSQQLTLTATDSRGCKSKASLEVDVVPPHIFAPRALCIDVGGFNLMLDERSSDSSRIRFYWDEGLNWNPAARVLLPAGTYKLPAQLIDPPFCKDSAEVQVYDSLGFVIAPADCEAFTVHTTGGSRPFSYQPTHAGGYSRFQLSDSVLQAPFDLLPDTFQSRIGYALGTDSCHRERSVYLLQPTRRVPQTSATPIQLYPNPGTSSFTLSGQFAAQDIVEVYDIQGKQLFRHLFSASQSVLTVDATDWASGLYFVRVSVNGQTTHNRMWIKN